MKLAKLCDWLDRTLALAAFDDVANNGLQLGQRDREVKKVAVAVDASVRAVQAAAAAGAELLIVHHGISWGGGIRYLTGGVGRVVEAAVRAELAIYGCHLPLDAHPELGNNCCLARELGLKELKPAFSYHGNVIGVIGRASRDLELEENGHIFACPRGARVGVCSGGAGEFVEAAQQLGCDLYVTGEANWGERIAAENAGMPMVCLGHYATEVYGVRALAAKLRKSLRLEVVELMEELR